MLSHKLQLANPTICQIKIKGDATPVSYVPNGLEFSDGSVLEADVIVFCTGFENDVRKDAARFFGPAIADQIDDCWGLDQEGEIRGVFKATGCPGLWYTGGGVNHARFFSRFIALAIQAERTGNPLPIYHNTLPRESERLESIKDGLPPADNPNTTSLPSRDQLSSST